MHVAFTICSNNYLAQAKALGDSLTRTNPDYKFIIGLVDRLSDEVDYSFFDPYEVIPIKKVGIEGFDEMFNKYNITELNTAVKPFIFSYLFGRSSEVENVIYFDPDILLYERFYDLENCLKEYDIVLTPHFFTPIYDTFGLAEPDILNAGLYNLGFLALRRSLETQRFLNWWMIKLKDYCFIDFKRGLFVDQLWINFVPLYFEKVFILRHLGYNVAYWNLHERAVSLSNNQYLINDQYPLVFYHFSGYDFNKPEFISKYQNRFTFGQREDVSSIFKDYHQKVISNQFAELSSIPCYYIQLKEELSQKQLSTLKRYRKRLGVIKQKIKSKVVRSING